MLSTCFGVDAFFCLAHIPYLGVLFPVLGGSACTERDQRFYSVGKENRWCNSLNKRLEDFILDMAISTSVILVPSRDTRKRRKLTKKNFKTLYKEYRPLNGSCWQFSTVHRYKKKIRKIPRRLLIINARFVWSITALAAELLNALENSIRGQTINLEIILKSCASVAENGEDNEVGDFFF